jgi:hypothetical protein
MYGITYMIRHYIAILRERSWCVLRDAPLRNSRYNIVNGRVVTIGLVRGDLISRRTPLLDTTHPSTIFYQLLLILASLRRHYERSLRMAM